MTTAGLLREGAAMEISTILALAQIFVSIVALVVTIVISRKNEK